MPTKELVAVQCTICEKVIHRRGVVNRGGQPTCSKKCRAALHKLRIVTAKEEAQAALLNAYEIIQVEDSPDSVTWTVRIKDEAVLLAYAEPLGMTVDQFLAYFMQQATNAYALALAQAQQKG